jgi:anti-sigma factor RsiW
MINCERMQERLIAYLDGNADSATRRQAEEHLSACAACRQRAEEFRTLWNVLDEVPGVAPSLSFDAAVRQHVAAEANRRGLWAWLVPSPRLAFGVTALLVLSIWLSSQRPAPPQAAAVPPNSEAEFGMIRDLPVLEDYEVLQDFDVLSELSAPQPAALGAPAQPVQRDE